MEQDDTRICMSKKLIGNLLNFIDKNRKKVALQRPDSNDYLVKEINGLNKQGNSLITELMSTQDFRDKINFKLKTRLFLKKVNDNK